MAQNDKPQTTEKTVAESTAFETSGPRKGKLKSGYQYRIEPSRTDDGRLTTKTVVTKVGS